MDLQVEVLVVELPARALQLEALLAGLTRLRPSASPAPPLEPLSEMPSHLLVAVVQLLAGLQAGP